MKRFLSSFIFLALFAASLFATEVTISSYTNANWQYGGSTARMVLYLDKQIVTTDNKVLNASLVGLGGWYKDISCTVTGTNLVCPSFTIDSTTDAQPNTAKYSVVFFDHRNTKRDIFAVIKVPPTPTPTTFGALIAYNAAPQRALPSTYYTSDQVNALFAAMIGSSARASDVIIGATKLSVPADSAETPIAVGTNDPRVAESSTTNRGTVKLDVSPASSSNPIAVGKNSYSSTTNNGVTALDTAPASTSSPIAAGINSPQITKNTKVLGTDYANLSAAISGIGSTATTLVIKSDITVSSTTNLATAASGMRLRFENGAKITVASGQTLTVGKLEDPGNVQIFSQADATSNIRFTAGAVDKINVAWFVGATPALITNAINQALGSVSANGGGTIYIPGEGTWTTAGDHATYSNLIIKGDGIATKLQATTGANNKPIFKQTDEVLRVSLEDLWIDGNKASTTGVTGYMWTGTSVSGDFTGHTTFKNVRISNCANGVYFYETGAGDFQTMDVQFVNGWIENNDIGFRSNSGNNVLNFTGKVDISPGQKAVYFTKAGQWTFHGVEFAGFPTKNGTEQVETNTVVVTTVTAGNAKSVVTASGLVGSPVTVTVPLAGGETAAEVATKFRRALGYDPKVSNFFHVAGTGADIQLIPIARAANDGTMNFTIEDVTSSGITDSITSTNTVAGVADTNNVGGIEIAGAHGPLTFYGGVTEGLSWFLQNNADDYNSIISLFGFQLQDPIILNNYTTLTTFGCYLDNKTIRAVTASARYSSYGDTLNTSIYLGGGFRALSATRATNFSGTTVTSDGSVQAWATNFNELENRSALTLKAFVGEDVSFGLNSDTGVFEALEGENNSTTRNQIVFGRANALGLKQHWFGITRSNSDGRAKFSSSQGLGYDFDYDITANGIKSTGLGIGYTTGAGGTVTQTSSRTTAVTLNKSSGAITLVSAAGSTSWASFTVNNSTVAATDTIVVSQKSGTNKYMIHVTAIAGGSFQITFATTGGSSTESPVFNFTVIKGATS